MKEDEIKTILEEPIPKSSKKRNSKKNQKKKQEKAAQEIEPVDQTQLEEESSVSAESAVSDQSTGDNAQSSPDEYSVPVSLSFLIFMRDLLNNIVPRTQWRPEEMAPVGMSINELTSIIDTVTSQNAKDTNSSEPQQEEVDGAEVN